MEKHTRNFLKNQRNLANERLYQCHNFYEFIEGMPVDKTSNVLALVSDLDLQPVTKDLNLSSDDFLKERFEESSFYGFV